MTGLRELLAVTDAAGKETKRYARTQIREAAEPLRDRWRVLMSPLNMKTAAGYRIVVRRTGVVAVEQSLRKTTGKRGDWGSTQMRRGVQAAEETSPEILQRVEGALERIAHTIG